MRSDISKNLSEKLSPLVFDDPVTHVYDPTKYAWDIHSSYVNTYCANQPVLLLGMNPGPWGMAQTGVPFGDVGFVKDWIGLCGEVGKPANEHPKRLIDGLNCTRSEVSGSRLWGWAKETYGTPERFFERFFVWNYCPLSFMEESGRNRTPDKLPVAERDALFTLCDAALVSLVEKMSPKWIIGVGAFAEKRAKKVVADRDIQVARILHPSPASPKANTGWSAIVTEQFIDLDIEEIRP